jgi:LuxR family maltose regulon positive regulatory protein
MTSYAIDLPEAGQASAPAFELLESKLRPLQDHATNVRRGTLIDLVESSAAGPIVVLSAGPGWGKTTLLAQWAASSDRPFAWISIDEGDNDPIVLLTYVAAALDRVSPLDPSVFDALARPGISLEATALPRLAANLGRFDQPVVLVLDDVHLLHNPTCFDAIETLAMQLPEGSQIALSARHSPTLPLGVLRARGLTVEIGPDELCMDAAEAGQLLRAAGANLPDAAVAELTEHTEGWPAGLYLAALSIRRSGDNGKRAAVLSGSDRDVSDYLSSELLAHLSPDELRFLRRTAVLEELSGPLCDAVLEDTGSAESLGSLARANLFLVPLDGNGKSYRYHHLFQELLRAELERAEPDLVPLLVGRAADWCEAHGHPQTAIGYAQRAGNVDRVARLVERWAQPVYQSGRVATVNGWLHWLEGHGALERNAAVAVLGALVAAVHGRPAEAERWAEVAERASYDGTLYDGSASIDSWLALLSALVCRKGVARMHADAELAVQTLARGSQFRPTALLFLALSHRLAGKLDEADDMLVDVAEEGLQLGAPEPVVVALGERASLAIGRGAWVEAEEFVERAALIIRRARLEDYPTSAYVYGIAARVALHREKPERAQELLTQAQPLRPRLTYALPHLAVQTRLELAIAYQTIADAAGAKTMLREIEPLLRRRPDLGTLTAQVDALRSSLKTMRVRAPGASTLTTAELRVIPYLGTHFTFREVGQRLFISHHTVKSHAVAIYRKLNVTSRNHAVERAHQLGLL